MVFEDVHWSDATTRRVARLFLIDPVPRLRVLVIITFRPEFTLVVGRPHVTIVSSEPPAAPECAEMIAR